MMDAALVRQMRSQRTAHPRPVRLPETESATYVGIRFRTTAAAAGGSHAARDSPIASSRYPMCRAAWRRVARRRRATCTPSHELTALSHV